MEKIKKSYVEKIYRGLLFSESVIDEVESRDPLLVEDDGSMQGFRFYDQEKILYAGRTFVGDNSNFSPWYFLGDRLSIEEVKELSKHNKGLNILVSNMEYNKIPYVCLTRVGSYLPMGEKDMTIDEYKEEIGSTRKLDK